MTRAPAPITCDTCGARIRFGRDPDTSRWRRLEEQDRTPFTQEATGAFVLVDRQAWRPADLVEHFMVRHEITETAAKELVAGFPFHQPHHCHPPTEEHTTP